METKDYQKELSKILHINKGLSASTESTWAEIYVEIGKLQERANTPHNCPPCLLPHFAQDNNPLTKRPYEVTCASVQGQMKPTTL